MTGSFEHIYLITTRGFTCFEKNSVARKSAAKCHRAYGTSGGVALNVVSAITGAIF